MYRTPERRGGSSSSSSSSIVVAVKVASTSRREEGSGEGRRKGREAGRGSDGARWGKRQRVGAERFPARYYLLLAEVNWGVRRHACRLLSFRFR